MKIKMKINHQKKGNFNMKEKKVLKIAIVQASLKDYKVIKKVK
jgi:hypothetical protein